MLYSEIIAVCSEIHTKHVNTLHNSRQPPLDIQHTYTLHITYQNYIKSTKLHSVNTTNLIVSVEQENSAGRKLSFLSTRSDHVTPRQQIYPTVNLDFSPCEDINPTPVQMLGYL
jgi:hypothetical protein